MSLTSKIKGLQFAFGAAHGAVLERACVVPAASICGDSAPLAARRLRQTLRCPDVRARSIACGRLGCDTPGWPPRIIEGGRSFVEGGSGSARLHDHLDGVLDAVARIVQRLGQLLEREGVGMDEARVKAP